MEIKTIKNLKDLAGKMALVRVDFNVPIKNGRVADDFKILKSLPTINFLIEKGAKVILVSHLGRPKGVDKKLSLKPVARHLQQLLGKKIGFAACPPAGRFAFLKKKLGAMQNGSVTMLENIRFSIDEEENTGSLAGDLAGLADLFVLDGFAAAHRAAASISGVAKHLPSYAGLLLEEELAGLSRAMENPGRPLVLVLGGAKAETKIPVLKQFLPIADYILISGGVSNTYLWATGKKVGSTSVQKEFKKEILKYCSKKKVIKPIDVVIGRKDGRNVEVLPINSKFQVRNSKFGIYDIGPRTVQLFSKYIKSAQTLVWNGALGMFEVHPYEYGTYAMTHLFAARAKGKAFGICGGGETVQVFEKLGLAKDVDLVSTGGGAMLEFLSGKKLPGVEAVRLQKISLPVKSK